MNEINSAFLKLMALEEDGNHHQVEAAEADFDDEDENWSQSSVEQHFASVLLD